MSNEKPEVETVPTYGGYLQVEKLLSAQQPYSGKDGQPPAHDEMMFIVVHQVYELWFKLMLHEMESFVNLLAPAGGTASESDISAAVARLERVIEILQIMNQQFRVMETMTPMGFLEFRNSISPASGFQSAQFRIFENRLGITRSQRVKYQQKEYYEVYEGKVREQVLESEKKTSVFEAVEKWLERTPFITFGSFNFWEHYKTAVNLMIARERDLFEKEDLTPEVRKQKEDALEKARLMYESLSDENVYNEKKERGVYRLSFRAIQAALLINIYQEKALLHIPFKLLTLLIRIDDLIAKWRHQHAMLVHKMIGSKVGTGGSSGYAYLKSTIERMRVFTDLFSLSSFILPRDVIPSLPKELVDVLSFTFEKQAAQGDNAQLDQAPQAKKAKFS